MTEIQICARDEFYRKLILKELEMFKLVGRATPEDFEWVCQFRELNEMEKDCLQIALITMGLWGER